MQRKVLVLIAAVMMMGSTSCKVSSLPTRHIFFPPQMEIVQDNMDLLAEALTKEVGLSLTKDDNLGLYSFIAEWKDVPYRFGANSKRGTDCSGFVYRLYKTVYEQNIGRSSAADLMSKCHAVPKSKLKEGDLIFFNVNNRRGGLASHVGVYLRDDLFVHAATRTGVTISSMNDPYYRQHYLGAGRID